MLQQIEGDLYITDLCWLPNSQTQLAIMTRSFIKVYDLSEDVLSPIFFFNQLEDEKGFNMMSALAMHTDTEQQTGGVMTVNNNYTRFYVGSASGKIYTYSLNNRSGKTENDGIYLIETVKLKGHKDVKAAVVSIHYSTSSKLIFVSYEDGTILFGKPSIDSTGEICIEKPISLEDKKITANIQNNHEFWKANCGYAVNWQDLGIQNNSELIAFCSIKEDNWVPVLLSISEKEVHLHVFKNQKRTVGLSYVRDFSSFSHVARLFVACDGGSISLYPIPGIDSGAGSDELPENIIKKHFKVDMLPKRVKMSTDVFESSIDLTSRDSDGFKFVGDYLEKLNGNRSSINVFRPNTDPIARCPGVNTFKVKCKLENQSADKDNSIVIIGIRVGLPLCSEDMFTIKVFNRTIKMEPNRKIMEIGFCDAEILYLHMVQNNSLSFEVATKDAASNPINIYGIDVLARKKSELNLDLKQKWIINYCESEHLTSYKTINSDAIKELLQSQDMPALVNWKEKFESTEALLGIIKSKSEKDEKRLLFYLSELTSNSVDYLSDDQIENELFIHICPLIGRYI